MHEWARGLGRKKAAEVVVVNAADARTGGQPSNAACQSEARQARREARASRHTLQQEQGDMLAVQHTGEEQQAWRAAIATVKRVREACRARIARAAAGSGGRAGPGGGTCGLCEAAAPLQKTSRPKKNSGRLFLGINLVHGLKRAEALGVSWRADWDHG